MKKRRALIVVGGEYHPFEAFGQMFKELLETSGQWEAEVATDRERFTALAGLDAVVLYTQGGALTPAQEQGLLGFVRGGGGLVGLHGATASFRSNPAYLEMIGSEFKGHGPATDIAVEHTAGYQAVLPRVERAWSQPDEFYQLEVRSRDPLQTVQQGWWDGQQRLLGYTRPYGRGRVFYSGLGHDERAFRNPNFRNMILKGLRWAAGIAEPPLRWGIVGYGPACGMGKHHAEFIRDTAGMTLAAVCDKDAGRVAVARAEQGEGLAYFTDTRALIESKACDGVTVVVPHNAHAAVTVPLLEAGLHVICEKPFAVTPDECDRMIEAARGAGAILSVYHSRHWDADMWAIRELVEAGEIGEVFAIEHNLGGYGRPWPGWRSSKEISGGCLYDMGAHGFEKVFQIMPRTEANRRATLFGHFAKKVWMDCTNEDYARAYVRFGGGIEAMVTQSSMCAAERPDWVVCGTRGACTTTPDGVQLRQVVNGTLRSTMVPYPRNLTWRSYYWNFADHAHAGVPLVITPQLAKAAIQCIHGCEQAARENRAIEVRLDI